MSARSLLGAVLALTVASGYYGFPYLQGPALLVPTRTYRANLLVMTPDEHSFQDNNVCCRFSSPPSGHGAPWSDDKAVMLGSSDHDTVLARSQLEIAVSYLSDFVCWGFGATNATRPCADLQNPPPVGHHFDRGFDAFTHLRDRQEHTGIEYSVSNELLLEIYRAITHSIITIMILLLSTNRVHRWMPLIVSAVDMWAKYMCLGALRAQHRVPRRLARRYTPFLPGHAVYHTLHHAEGHRDHARHALHAVSDIVIGMPPTWQPRPHMPPLLASPAFRMRPPSDNHTERSYHYDAMALLSACIYLSSVSTTVPLLWARLYSPLSSSRLLLAVDRYGIRVATVLGRLYERAATLLATAQYGINVWARCTQLSIVLATGHRDARFKPHELLTTFTPYAEIYRLLPFLAPTTDLLESIVVTLLDRLHPDAFRARPPADQPPDSFFDAHGRPMYCKKPKHKQGPRFAASMEPMRPSHARPPKVGRWTWREIIRARANWSYHTTPRVPQWALSYTLAATSYTTAVMLMTIQASSAVMRSVRRARDALSSAFSGVLGRLGRLGRG